MNNIKKIIVFISIILCCSFSIIVQATTATLNNVSPSFNFIGNENLNCIAEKLTWIFAPQKGTTATVIFAIKNPMETWYRVKVDKTPVISSNSYSSNYSDQQIKTCQWAPKIGREELNYWVEDKYIPENIKTGVVDMEAIGKQTLGVNSFNIDRKMLIRECPSSTCEAEWLGGWGGIATIINQNSDKNWYEVVISNVDTSHFSEFGGDGWISKDSVPGNLKPLSIPPFSQNITPASTIKNNKGGFNLSITRSELLNFIYLLVLVLVLIIIFVFRKKIGVILKHKKIAPVYKEVEVRKNKVRLLPTLLVVVVVIILIGTVFAFVNYSNTENNKNLEAKANYNLGLQEINKTVENNNEESQKQITALEQKIAELEQQKTSNQPESSSSLSTSDINNIIGSTVYVLCAADANHSIINQGSGSVWQFPKSQDYFIFTNAHVVSTTDGSAPNCVAVFPELPSGEPKYIYNVDFDSRNYQDGIDWALLKLTTPFSPEYTLNQIPTISNYSQCNFADVNIGDKVTVFGYPAVGGKNVTVTEGNISGFSDSDYKVSSGMIDHGNSGGVAVLNKSRCILGIPTWVSVGEASSVGIIESWRTIYGDSSK